MTDSYEWKNERERENVFLTSTRRVCCVSLCRVRCVAMRVALASMGHAFCSQTSVWFCEPRRIRV